MVVLLGIIAAFLGIIAIALVYGREAAAKWIEATLHIGKIIFIVALGIMLLGGVWLLITSVSAKTWLAAGNVTIVIFIYGLFLFLVEFLRKVIGPKLPIFMTKELTLKGYLLLIAAGVAIFAPAVLLLAQAGIK